VEQLQALIAASGLEDRIELGGAFCMGRCVNGVSLVLNGIYHSLKPEDTGAFFTENILKKMSGT
jgi:NADH:ubiquinone oxidoreductase subunit E